MNITMNRIPLLAVTLITLLLFLPLAGCRDRQAPQAVTQTQTPRIGHHPSPLLGPLYAAQGGKEKWQMIRFNTGGDIGYALIAGEIDAGFVDTHKAIKLLGAPGGENLVIAGAIQFPYGATLVLRKDLKLRLTDLAGTRLAALEPDCQAKRQFEKDAKRHGLDPKKLLYSYMPFDQMLPALEARSIDGAVVKGAYGVLAELQGHKILYQNWDVKAVGDDCCPPSIAQTEFFLVARQQSAEKIKPLITALTATGTLAPSVLRAAISGQVGYPREALEQFPTATFEPLNDEQRKLLGETRCTKAF